MPHEVSTKVHAVETYRKSGDIGYVCRKYHISKASLMRWNRLYDGTRESLMPKSHRPHTAHPNAHTEQEIKWIKDYHRRNPNISICELYGKLREDKAYSRHPGSLYRVFVRLGFRKKVESTKIISLWFLSFCSLLSIFITPFYFIIFMRWLIKNMQEIQHFFKKNKNMI